MSDNNLNFAFFGTPDVASKTLDILFDYGYTPSIIITSPDKPAGRGLHLTPSPVSIWAEKHNISCLKPEKIDIEFIEKLKKENISLSVVVAYGKILPEEIINIPKLGTINIHYSLLPKYRGASPLESSLLNGDAKTGVSIQKMVFKLDSGPILKEEEISININDTKEELRNKLIGLGAINLIKIIPEIYNNKITGKEQNENDASYCKKIKKEDGLLDITNGNHKENWNKYRAYYGWPNTFFFINKNGKEIRVKITKAKYENDSFQIERVIPEGKKEISYSDFLKN